MLAVITNKEWEENMEAVKKRLLELNCFENEDAYNKWADDILTVAIEVFLNEINIYYSDKRKIDL